MAKVRPPHDLLGRKAPKPGIRGNSVESTHAEAPVVQASAEQIRAVVVAAVAHLQHDLIELVLQPLGVDWRIAVSIDRLPGRGGINIDECAAVSREISCRLDGPPTVADNYELEVASPGPERLLRHAADLQRFSGTTAKVSWADSTGSYSATGVLDGVSAEGILLLGRDRRNQKRSKLAKLEEKSPIHAVPVGAIAEARLAPNFDEWLAIGRQLAHEAAEIEADGATSAATV